MKYIVMECHPGYTVLMDEESRFVYAANLRYQVGQTVEHPVLMEQPAAAQPGISVSVRKLAAAAACLVLLAGTGFLYYRSNLAVQSIIVFSAEGGVSIEVNRRGKVLSVKSNDPAGEALISGYQAKGKDQLTVTKELVQRAVSSGKLRNGDTVSVYVHTPEAAEYGSYQFELEQEVASYSDLDLHTNVQYYDTISDRVPDHTVSPATLPETRTSESLPAAAPAPVDPKSEETPVKPSVPETPLKPETAKPAAPHEDPIREHPAEAEKPEPVKPAGHPAEQQAAHPAEPARPHEEAPAVKPAVPEVQPPAEAPVQPETHAQPETPPQPEVKPGEAPKPEADAPAIQPELPHEREQDTPKQETPHIRQEVPHPAAEPAPDPPAEPVPAAEPQPEPPEAPVPPDLK